MKGCQVIISGLTEYQQSLALQRELFYKRHTDEIGDTLLLTQHFPVYTCGRSSEPTSLIKDELPPGMELIKVDRGGSLTFHGPGQLMVYPIISIKESGAMSYLRSLEQVVISAMAVYGIKATRKEQAGVWVGDKKLASVGIKISSGITMHGLALNVNCDLKYFKHIKACGLDKEVTSMQNLLGYEIEMEDMIDLIIINFGKIFYYKMLQSAERENDEQFQRKVSFKNSSGN